VGDNAIALEWPMVTSGQGSEGVPVARDPSGCVTSGALRYATRLVIVEVAGGDYLLTWVGAGFHHESHCRC
jgi:hypothetical protein